MSVLAALSGLAIIAVVFENVKRWLLASLTVCCLILTTTVACRYAADKACWYSIREPIAIHAGPGLLYHATNALKPGEIVCIQARHGDWVCVQNKNCRGWLPLKL